MDKHDSAVLSTGHQFLEGLRWHDGHLWASDFFAKRVVRFEEDGSFETVATIEGTPSGLGFLPDGTPLVVSQADRKVLTISSGGELSEYADFSHLAGGLGNDMLVTQNGHAYVGNFGYALGEEDPKPTSLAHITPDRVVHKVESEVTFPNGTVLTADGGTLLVAETWDHRISAFDVAPDGTPSNKRVWAQLDDAYNPDGIALDTDGGVWFGNVLVSGDGGGFFRVSEGGTVTDQIVVGSSAWGVSCAFGGEGSEVLYLSCNTSTFEDFGQGRSKGVIASAAVGRAGTR